MESAEFARRWNEYVARTGNAEAMPLVTVALPDTRASAQTVRFLAEAGLPQGWSGPFTFDLAENLNHVSDVFGCYGQPDDWDPDVYERLNRYMYLGFDGGGNPICLDSADREKVVFLDHERFLDPDLRGQFINSSVCQLAECVLIFQEMLDDYWQEQGAEAELYEGNVPARLVEQALEKMRGADPGMLVEGGYWPEVFSEHLGARPTECVKVGIVWKSTSRRTWLSMPWRKRCGRY